MLERGLFAFVALSLEMSACMKSKRMFMQL